MPMMADSDVAADRRLDANAAAGRSLSCSPWTPMTWFDQRAGPYPGTYGEATRTTIGD